MTLADDSALSLLVVDDDAVDRKTLRRALAASGIAATVTEERDAPEALAKLAGGGFDCMLLDFRLPKMDGLAVLRVARERRIETPIVVLTGHGDEQLAVELMKAGAADYIPKGALTAQRIGQSVLHAVRMYRAELAAEQGRRRVERLHGFSAALAGKRTVAEVAEVVVHEGRVAFDAPRALVGVVDGTDTNIQIIRASGYGDDALAAWSQVPIDAPLPFADAIRRCTPLYFEDAASLMARYPHLAGQRVAGDEALIVLPLLIGAKAVGVVAFTDDRPRRLSGDDESELAAFARVCAQAFDRAQLFDLAQVERRRAEEASRAKDEFLAVVSHELRTPLNAILGWAKMLGSGALNAEQCKRATETIERNAKSQAQLIEDLLDISRIITGKLRIETAPTDVAAVIDAALDVVRPAADAKGVRLAPALDRRLGAIVVDAERLQQVFWNLLSNAVKFTSRGGHASIALSQLEGAYVVTVEDSGQGIAREFLPYVFDRFRQQETGTSRKTSGLGLGLAIVRHIVELHGGSIAVASEGPGQGSSFTVRLPVEAARTNGTPLPAGGHEGRQSDASTLADLPRLTGLRVLIVDDTADTRDLIHSVLTACDAEVTVVSSAAEGLETLEARRPDVLVSDIGMPIDDGYAFIERVRALSPDRGGETPAIALTAYARPEDRARALLAGYTTHAAKPISPRELVRLVAAVAKGRAA